MADVAEEYRSSLSELNFNSKPHINMLTMIAEENIKHAPLIVQTIVDHINSVPPDMKLPSMYLVDSIIKNIGKIYVPLFSKHLVQLFTSVFEKVDENIRSLLYKLRSTWSGLFPNSILLRLDKSVVALDPAWPILAQPKTIHVNPKFLDGSPTAPQIPKKEEISLSPQSALLQEANEIKKKQLEVLKVLQAKKQQLMELKRKAAASAPLLPPEPSQVEKHIDTRDPRIGKKISTSIPDAVPLQSVVVVPKTSHAQATKKSEELTQEKEKEPLSPESKKPRLSTVDDDVQDEKIKSSITPDDSKRNSKSNGHQHKSQNSRVSENQMIVVNNENKIKNKKRTLSPNSSHFDIEFDKKVHVSVPDSTRDLGDSFLHKNITLSDDVPSQPKYLKGDIHSNFLSGKNQSVMLDKDNKGRGRYNRTTKDSTKISYKSVNRCRPLSPPLLFGNEDKDYRTLLPKKEDLDERVLNENSFIKRPSVPVVKSFKLDNKERKVYFVDDRSFAVMDDNTPRELTFEGPPKLVFIEGLPQPIELGFGGQIVKFEIDGKWHSIKFGSPSREIYIDDFPYEAQFGGPPFMAIFDNGKAHRIQISGPPPQVIVSQAPATELYKLFCQTNQEFLSRYDNRTNVNHEDMQSVHDVDMRVTNGRVSSIFYNFPLEKVNDVDWQRMPVGDSQTNVWNAPKNSFESFKDAMPNFVAPKIFTEKAPDWSNRPLPVSEMNTTLQPPPLPPKQIINRLPDAIPPCVTFVSTDTTFVSTSTTFSTPSMPVPQFSKSESIPVSLISETNTIPFPHQNQVTNLSSKPPEFPPSTQFSQVQLANPPRLAPPPLPPFFNSVSSSNILMPTPTLSSSNALLPTPKAPPNSKALLPTPSIAPSSNALLPTPKIAPISSSLLAVNPVAPPGHFSVSQPNTTILPPPPIQVTAPSTTLSSSISKVPSAAVNVDLFLEKLIAAGIIGKKSSTPPPDSEKKTEGKNEELVKEEPIPEIRFETRCLKQYHPGVINALHNGSQCATCGMRFKEIQSEQYSRHLDWHFRMNRREKDGAKKPFSRRLFFEIKDWIEFKEFEEVDERAPSYFELQANDEQTEESEPENICSVPSSQCDTEICSVCSEQFQLFWVEEEEEWHLKNAVKHDDQVYHPACYEDFKKVTDSAKSELDISTCIKEEEEGVDEKVENDVEMTESEVKDENVPDIKTEPQETETIDKNEQEPVATTEEKPETTVEESTTAVEKLTVTIKEEPAEIPSANEEKTTIDNLDSIPETTTLKSDSKQEQLKSEQSNSETVIAESSPSSPSEKITVKCEEEEEIEFRPPTPDPRFQVLPPVSRGTELSALCTIM